MYGIGMVRTQSNCFRKSSVSLLSMSSYSCSLTSTYPRYTQCKIYLHSHFWAESSYGQTETIDRSRIKEWKYEQPVKIPSYLIAIAAGELVYKQMGERTGVWADPVTLEMAYSEFASTTEKFISAAEKIIGVDYDWGTYDLLVLPPSFPYGGMENSNLTFLTPSLLTGDKSLVDVVAHEISHSWFGNNDQPKFQQLEIQYEFGEDPDLAFSSVPYDKGANFLLYLEDVVGGLSIFLPYASDYVKTFKGKSLDTTMWKDHLFKYFENQSQVLSKLKTVDWEAWLHGHGLELPVQPKYDTSLADDAYALAKKWTLARTDQSIEFSPDDIKDFSSNQIVVFLEKLDEEVDCFSKSMIDTMQLNYRFNETKNQEIGLRWYLISLKSSCFCQDAATWVSTKGRMKFARPVYRALFKVEPLLARKTFQENADFYHPICRALSTPIHPSPILDTQAQQVLSNMSRPEAVSRNPFMPPPNTVTFSASSWATTQALTFNVLFSIIDQNRRSAEGEFAPSSPSSDDGLWPPSDRPWTSSSSFSQSTDTGNSQLDADHLHQYNIDQS
ncbi:hypothetical protein H4Q26_016227 [Puccinia striiformis f. sp. tritici PST-130]|nr:hypothetical protein H4Q26_016227 [Puccinia striiformis f. sp. tritici PST-130]